jgi:hypothetical protein
VGRISTRLSFPGRSGTSPCASPRRVTAWLLPTLIVGLAVLSGCSDNEAERDDGSQESPTSAVDPGASSGEVGGEVGLPVSEVTLDVGDCWGRDDEIVLDPIPCSGPHIFEVVGMVTDWDHEQYAGGFEQGVAEDEAMRDLCDGFAADYFRRDPLDDGIATDHGEPKYYGQPEVVVCSAHSGPGVDPFRSEIEGSFADRGLR